MARTKSDTIPFGADLSMRTGASSGRPDMPCRLRVASFGRSADARRGGFGRGPGADAIAAAGASRQAGGGRRHIAAAIGGI